MRKLVLEQNGWLSGEIAPEYQGRTDLVALRYGAARLDNLVVRAGGALRRRPGTWQFIRQEDGDTLRTFVLSRFLVQAWSIEVWNRFTPEELRRVLIIHNKVVNDPNTSDEVREQHRKEIVRVSGLIPIADALTPEERKREIVAYAMRENGYSLETARKIASLTHYRQAVEFHEIAYADTKTRGFFRIYNSFRNRSYYVIDAEKHEGWLENEIFAAQYAAVDASTWIFVTPRRPPMLLRKKVLSRNRLAERYQGSAIWEVQIISWDGDALTHYNQAPAFKPESGAQLYLHPYHGVSGQYWGLFSTFSGHPNWYADIVDQRLQVGNTQFRVVRHRAVRATDSDTGIFYPYLPQSLRGNTEARDFAILRKISGENPPTDTWLDNWSVHAFGRGLGWPTAVAFHENRLVLAGSGTWGRRRVWLSKINEPLNFNIDKALADNALDVALPEDDKICSLVSGTELEIYAERGEWALSGEPITAEQAQLRKVGTRGSRSVPYVVQPVRAAGATVFVDRNGSPALLRWVGETLQHRSESLRGLAPHIASDFVSMAWDPKHDRLLGVRSDGTIACGTWLPEQNTLAWTRWHILPRRYLGEADYGQEDVGKSGFLSISSGSGIVGVSTRRDGRFAVEVFDENLGTDATLIVEESHKVGSITRKGDGADSNTSTLDTRWEVFEFIPAPLASLSATDSGMTALGISDTNARYRPLFTDRTAPGYAQNLYSARVGTSAVVRLWGAAIETRLEPLPTNLPTSMLGGRQRVRLVSLDILARRPSASRRSPVAHAHGLLTTAEDFGFFTVGGRLVVPVSEQNILRRSSAQSAQSVQSEGTQETERDFETLRLRGTHWQVATAPLWVWLQPFAETAELLSARTELRIGDL